GHVPMTVHVDDLGPLLIVEVEVSIAYRLNFLLTKLVRRSDTDNLSKVKWYSSGFTDVLFEFSESTKMDWIDFSRLKFGVHIDVVG
ncbi:hypothetical protein E4U24_008163, partial [Claviceps purpurea]